MRSHYDLIFLVILVWMLLVFVFYEKGNDDMPNSNNHVTKYKYMKGSNILYAQEVRLVLKPVIVDIIYAFCMNTFIKCPVIDHNWFFTDNNGINTLGQAPEHEGQFYRNCFWLYHHDDEAAIQIIEGKYKNMNTSHIHIVELD